MSRSARVSKHEITAFAILHDSHIGCDRRSRSAVAEDRAPRDGANWVRSAIEASDAHRRRSAEQAVLEQRPGSVELLGALTSSPAEERAAPRNRTPADRSLPTALRADVLTDMTSQARPTSETFHNLATLMNDPDPKISSGATLARLYGGER